MEKVIKEADRLAGPSPGFLFDREAAQDMMIAEIPVKKGMKVNYLSKPNLFDPQNFPEPTEFKPQRFEDERFKNS